jgi:hypothetical protein
MEIAVIKTEHGWEKRVCLIGVPQQERVTFAGPNADEEADAYINWRITRAHEKASQSLRAK